MKTMNSEKEQDTMLKSRLNRFQWIRGLVTSFIELIEYRRKCTVKEKQKCVNWLFISEEELGMWEEYNEYKNWIYYYSKWITRYNDKLGSILRMPAWHQHLQATEENTEKYTIDNEEYWSRRFVMLTFNNLECLGLSAESGSRWDETDKWLRCVLSHPCRQGVIAWKKHAI